MNYVALLVAGADPVRQIAMANGIDWPHQTVLAFGDEELDAGFQNALFSIIDRYVPVLVRIAEFSHCDSLEANILGVQNLGKTKGVKTASPEAVLLRNYILSIPYIKDVYDSFVQYSGYNQHVTFSRTSKGMDVPPTAGGLAFFEGLMLKMEPNIRYVWRFDGSGVSKLTDGVDQG